MERGLRTSGTDVVDVISALSIWEGHPPKNVETATGGRRRKCEMERTSRRQNGEEHKREVNKKMRPHMKLSNKDWDAFKANIEKEKKAAVSCGYRALLEWLDQMEGVLNGLRKQIAEQKPCDEGLLEAIEHLLLCNRWLASPQELIEYNLYTSSVVQRADILCALDSLNPDELELFCTEMTLKRLAED